MSKRFSFPILFLALAARGDEVGEAVAAREAAFSAFEAQYDALDKRLPRDGALRSALDRAGADRSTMRTLLSEAKDRASAISSAKFKMDFQRREWESARKEAERIGAAKDARYEELMRGAASTRDTKYADTDRRKVDIEAWRTRLNAQWKQYEEYRDQVAPLMRTYTLPDEQAAYDHAKACEAQRNSMYDACKAENDRFNAAVEVLNTDNKAIGDEWTRRLAEIEEFVKEDGRRTLEATQVASKKELEFRDAEAKFKALWDKERATLNDLGRRLQAAAAALQAVVEADTIRSAATGGGSSGGAVPYETRATPEAAVAVAPPPSPAGGVRSHVFVLPPAAVAEEAGGTEEAQRESAALAAEAIAAQFQPADAPAVALTDVPVPPASPVPDMPPPVAPPPAVFLGPAPLAGIDGFDDGSADVVVLDESALTRLFHPGVFISDAEYRRACDARARAAELIPKLEQQVARMRAQRGGLSGEQAEFDAMRREIALGATREVIGVYATRLDMLAKNRAFAATLSEAQKKHLETAKRALDTLKLGLALPGAGPNADQRETWEEGSAALAELAGSQISGEWAGKFFEQGGNMLKAGGKLNRHLEDPNVGTRPWPQELGQNLKTSIEIVGTWCPPVALGIGLEAVGERGLEWAITQDAVDSLRASVGSTDDAIVFLEEKLRRTREMSELADRTIRNRDGAAAGRRRLEGAR